MALTRWVPLTALLVAAGSLTAGFAAQASAIDERIEGFVQADSTGRVDVAEATGYAANGSVDRIYLVLEPTFSHASVDLDDLGVAGPRGDLGIAETKALRDDDGSLEEGVLEGADLVQVQLLLESGMEKGEERTLALQLTDRQQGDELHLSTPAALEDGYTRLDADLR